MQPIRDKTKGASRGFSPSLSHQWSFLCGQKTPEPAPPWRAVSPLGGQIPQDKERSSPIAKKKFQSLAKPGELCALMTGRKEALPLLWCSDSQRGEALGMKRRDFDGEKGRRASAESGFKGLRAWGFTMAAMETSFNSIPCSLLGYHYQ